MYKKIGRVTALAAVILFLFAGKILAQTSTDLIISEYVEGSSNNKAIEFYNGTTSSINLTGGNYVLQMYFNGSSSASTVISLTGTIAPGGVFVLAQSSASFAASAFVNQTSSASFYNGDDALVLRKGGASGTIVDVIGQVGFDPGTEWGAGLVSTADNTIRRKPGVCSGDINAADVFDPAVEWDGFATDDFSGLGAHTSACTTGPISISAASLTFTTVAGTSSAQQTYTVQGNGLTSDINVNVPALSSFGISLTSGGPYTAGLVISAAVANAGAVPVYVVFNPTAAGTQSGNITHSSGAATANLPVQGSATSSGGITRIFEIQGIGSASPFTGNSVTTEGIVTASFQGANQLSGFFVQDTAGDNNSLSSDGIFVFNTSFTVAVGDYVRLTGNVVEFFNKTELQNLTGFTKLSSGNTVMSPVAIQLPVAAVDDLERYEGMLVTFPQVLTATETFTLGRFGEVALSANGRRFNPTNFVDPNDNPATGTNSNGNSNVAAVSAQQDLNDRSRILLDDASSVQNPPIVPYLNPADSTLRVGSTITGLTGALDYDFSVYRLQPTVSPAFNYAPRPAVPAVGAANVKVGSFNVLNFFNGDGLGGGFPTSRGANTLVEFNRQRAKIVSAIKTLNTDILGLTEIENDGNGANSAIADLVNGLNTATAPGTYAFIADPTGTNGNTGTDEIKVAIIYKPSVVTPSGLAKADISPIHNRPPLAQTFTVNSTGEKFTVIINHFKSKSCSGATGLNADQLDGQGCYNSTRKQQAAALLSFIATLQTASGDSDVISLGDYNAYEEEDPIDVLRAGGLINAIPGTYSYVFDGQSGSLDYAFTTASLAAQLTGANKWHINADEPIVKDYNQEFNPPYVYNPGPFRSSDHDPVITGLKLGNQLPLVAITSPANNSVYAAGHPINLTAVASDADGSIARVSFYNNGVKFLEDSTAPYGLVSTDAEPGSYVITARATDNEGAVKISDTVRLTITGCTAAGSITGEGYTNIPGTQVSDLTSNAAYPNNPSINALLSEFEYANVGDNYGARVRGYICAPQTGNYTFYIAGDDQAGLWLSTDESATNKVLIAYNEVSVGFRAWTTFATQQSAPVKLVKGARYYIETLHKQGAGANHLSVGWVLPDGTQEGPIPGNRLSPVAGNAGNRVAQDFTIAMEKINSVVTGLQVKASPNPSNGYFTIITNSSDQQPLSITVTDVLGRTAERKTNIAANGTIRMGGGLKAGIYFIEVSQGNQKQRLKVVKQ